MDERGCQAGKGRKGKEMFWHRQRRQSEGIKEVDQKKKEINKGGEGRDG